MQTQAIAMPVQQAVPTPPRRGIGLFWLRRVLGIHLGRLHHHTPQPLRLPAHYWHSPIPAQPPLISIVVPSLNQGQFLQRTLRSVLNQRYPRLELVVQDGGSHDETLAILRRHERHLEHWESAPDRGQAHAINLGFGHTSGEIMAYLNSDDILLPGTLAYVARYLAEHPKVDAVYGHRVIVDEQDREIGRWVLPPHDGTVLTWADFVPQETLFWRRSTWDRVGSALDESLHFALDWDLLLRFQAAGARIVRLPRFLGGFRLQPEQKTRTLLATIGEQEMSRLRRRCHGREVTSYEIRRAILPYLLRQGLYHHLYKLGLLRY